MTNLTASQRRALEIALQADRCGDYAIGSNKNHIYQFRNRTEYLVIKLTANALVKRGFMLRENFHYAITEAGKAALR